MSVLAFDVETTGLVIKDKPLSDPAQPRVVQLGFVVHDHMRRPIHTYSTLIRPEGWEIAKQAADVHGFSTEDCSRYGVDIRVALLDFVAALKTVRCVAAHGLGFDMALVQRELDLLKAADLALRRPRLRRICTMKTGAAMMADGKWPELSVLYRYLTGERFLEAHDALEDAKATAACFWGLVDRRMIEL